MTQRKPTYLEALAQRVLIYDGAMGTSIDTFTLTAEDYGGERTNGNRDYLVITRKDWLADPTGIVQRGAEHFAFPGFVKPANRGSSVGIVVTR